MILHWKLNCKCIVLKLYALRQHVPYKSSQHNHSSQYHTRIVTNCFNFCLSFYSSIADSTNNFHHYRSSISSILAPYRKLFKPFVILSLTNAMSSFYWSFFLFSLLVKTLLINLSLASYKPSPFPHLFDFR